MPRSTTTCPTTWSTRADQRSSSAFNDMGIEVHEIAPDAETLLLASSAGARVDDTAAEEAAATLSALDAEGGRTTDPVRMYMREMGTVEPADARGRNRDCKTHRGRPGTDAVLAGQLPVVDPDAARGPRNRNKADKRAPPRSWSVSNDVEEAEALPVEETSAGPDWIDSDDDDDGGGDEDTGPTGPDPGRGRAAAWRRWAPCTPSSRRPYAKNGASAKPVLKAARRDNRLFMTRKLPLPLTETRVRKLRDIPRRDRATTSAASSTRPRAWPRCRARTSSKAREGKPDQPQWVDELLKRKQ